MLRRGGIVGLAILLSCAAARADSAADADAMMAQGERYFAKGDYAAAIGIFNAAHILAPDRPGPLLGLGLSYAAASQCQEAVPLLEQYVTLQGRDAKPEGLRALAACRHAVAPTGAAKLSIATEPAGAEVRIDSPNIAPVGVTPLEGITLQPGAHTLFLRKEGFQTVSRSVRAEPGGTISLELALQSLAATPSVRAERAVARAKLALVKQLEIAGWAVTGLTGLTGFASAGAELSACSSNSGPCLYNPQHDLGNELDVISASFGGLSFLSHVTVGALAGVGASHARDGERALGLPSGPSALWIAGWTTWSVGLAYSMATLTAAAVLWGAGPTVRPAFGTAALVGTFVNLGGELLLQFALRRQRQRLEAALASP
jgi:hypothetical protein